MSIHSSKKHAGGEDDRGCKSVHITFIPRANWLVDFYNYFDHGIDFLISDSTHIVKKIVLHTNIVSVAALTTQLLPITPRKPGTPLFQRYKRCSWEIEGSPEDDEDGMYCGYISKRYYLQGRDRHTTSKAILR